jgi:hypothetical protein
MRLFVDEAKSGRDGSGYADEKRQGLGQIE